MSAGPWSAKNMMPSKKEKKSLKEASGHFIFSLLSEEFSFSRSKEREANCGALSRATRLASEHSESAFIRAAVGEPQL